MDKKKFLREINRHGYDAFWTEYADFVPDHTKVEMVKALRKAEDDAQRILNITLKNIDKCARRFS